MESIIVEGGRPLEGKISVSGAKNSVLPLLAAAILFRGGCLLHNCPRLSDVAAAAEILEHLGCRVDRTGHSIWVDAQGLCRDEIPRALMERMRSSILFLGPLLARTGQCTLYEPGGCCLGARPIDLHLAGLEALGAEFTWDRDRLVCRGKLRGGAVTLPFPSVGATENLILAALGAEGTTTIYHAAREPEIGDLIGFLTAGGARIYGAGTSMLHIEGGFPDAAVYTVLPDRMEAATFLAATASAGGDLCLERTRPGDYVPVTEVLRAAGCRIAEGPGEIRIQAPAQLQSVSPIRTAPYPGFPTDAQAPVMAALLRSQGVTVFEETVFADRYRHVPALRALGGRIQVSGAIAALTGVPELHGAVMEATDLRGGAAMVVGALGAQGTSRIGGVRHILRGYEDFARRLAAVGANIRMEHEAADGCYGGLYYGLGRTGKAAQEKAP